MRFETVNFNIFEENLQELVYKEKSAPQSENREAAEKRVKKVVRKLKEIIIKPLTKKASDREK